ncbi:hypothetical protein FR483_n159R [Paramecium bursaria Chlorella virus FR483]|uniref:Uncharacterized protein n159R n=1 Tax=Paramecium bursaria Chlorella virus FR483 TaxID=399781 RepID=A7J6L3_PBCVF|nr:hypothetical protein FR483_n159R [Paramecium bursaria Chlorella virus FR483]ABT15444.1 hypothetical protein FR483_n159R [Paramecium bursaria Chlorella virus FR483]
MVAGSRVSPLLCQQFQPPMFVAISLGRTQMSLTLSQMLGATLLMWCSSVVMSQSVDRSMSLATWCHPS